MRRNSKIIKLITREVVIIMVICSFYKGIRDLDCLFIIFMHDTRDDGRRFYKNILQINAVTPKIAESINCISCSQIKKTMKCKNFIMCYQLYKKYRAHGLSNFTHITKIIRSISSKSLYFVIIFYESIWRLSRFATIFSVHGF